MTMMPNTYVAIVGVGRSGTSLLQSMLHAHPIIEFLPETQFLRKHLLKNGEKRFLNNIERESFCAVLEQDEKFKRLGINPKKIVDNSNSYLECYEKIQDQFRNENTRYVGDKDPRFLDFIPTIKEVLPKAKIVHIIRDPRDVILSRTKADWSKHWPFFMHVFIYKAQLERGRSLGLNLFQKNYLELYYEDLIKEPELELKRVSDFLEIEYTDKMLDFGESAKKLVDKNEMQWKKETLGPLLKNNNQKWKNELSNQDIYLIQEVCSEAYNRHPYVKSNVKVSFFYTLKVKVLKFASILFSFLYPLRIRFIK